MEASPCPWCNKIPDSTSDSSFRYFEDGSRGAVVCCGVGPTVPTGGMTVEGWRDSAIAAWNNRPPTGQEQFEQKTKQILEKFDELFGRHVLEIHSAYAKYLGPSQSNSAESN